MKEFIDENNQVKMMALLICGIGYGEDKYLVYSIRREQDEANIFVSKLITTSGGYVINNDFSNGEKGVIDKVIQRLISKEDIHLLERDGYSIFSNITIEDTTYFNVDKCYVATVSVKLIKDCLKYYNLVTDNMLNAPNVEVIDDNKKFNEGFVGNVFVILFGVFILVFSVCVIISIVFK